jgi:hypothetical protein
MREQFQREALDWIKTLTLRKSVLNDVLKIESSEMAGKHVQHSIPEIQVVAAAHVWVIAQHAPA